jgi:hypothetical protein
MVGGWETHLPEVSAYDVRYCVNEKASNKKRCTEYIVRYCVDQKGLKNSKNQVVRKSTKRGAINTRVY